MSTSSEVSLTLVLASGSPRRSRLLRAAEIRLEVLPADTPEHAVPGEAPEQMARRLAAEKAQAVADRLGPEPPRWVLGADTIVVIDGDVLGKPTDAKNAEALLGRLSGRTHEVITGVSLVDSAGSANNAFAVVSQVRMRPSSAEERREYVATGEPMDKAGAYAVQGLGRTFVDEICGSESNVIGLPMEETLSALSGVGIVPVSTMANRDRAS